MGKTLCLWIARFDITNLAEIHIIITHSHQILACTSKLQVATTFIFKCQKSSPIAFLKCPLR